MNTRGYEWGLTRVLHYSSNRASVPSFQLQIKSFTKVHKDVVFLLEPGQGEIGGHCMTLVTRYLLVNRAEREVNSVLTSLLIGSDRQNGLYMGIRPCMFGKTTKESLSLWYTPFGDTACCLGVMPSIKGSDSRSVKMFPSQQKAP